MKFLLDIPFARSTTNYLNSRGHDAVHVIERLPATASDTSILLLAAVEARIVICFDLDFGRLVATSAAVKPSVMTFRTTGRGAAFVERKLEEILPSVLRDLDAGALVVIEDHAVRVRLLPVAHERKP